jgi:signal transduction histidine kinase
MTRITVTDDGVGFPSGTGDTVERIGMANVRERLRLAYPDARMAVESSPGQGTRICIEIRDGQADA